LIACDNYIEGGATIASGYGQSSAIRRAVVADGSLSMTAKNVKIITANGVVTLRGPVLTAAEKAAIAKHARDAGGKAKIVDQLEVKKAAK
jgi:osmotically-inducible protein OsmY